MVRYRFVLGGLLLLLVYAYANGARTPTHAARTAPPSNFQQCGYLWQQAWTPAVSEAVLASRDQLPGGLLVLAAEIRFHEGQARVDRPSLDLETLAASGVPVGLVLRLGPGAGPFHSAPSTQQLVQDWAWELIHHAQTAGVRVQEFQVDYDCPTRLLPDYAFLLAALRRSTGTLPLTITALPTWIGASGWAPLLKAVDGYVLQVHQIPGPTDDPALPLCDPAQARAWIAAASAAGVPFRVALPTYTTWLIHDRAGDFAAIVSEGPLPRLPRDAKVGVKAADPVSLAPLVAELVAAPPPHCIGIAWFRVPVAGEERNWSWPTLRAVMAGRTPEPRLLVTTNSPEAGLVDVVLENAGEADAPLPQSLRIRFDGSTVEASDGAAHYTPGTSSTDAIRFRRRPSALPQTLPPGARLPIGWLRLEGSPSVTGEVLADE